MSRHDMNDHKTTTDLRRERFENTSAVASAMLAADRKARAEKNARLRAAREATEKTSQPTD